MPPRKQNLKIRHDEDEAENEPHFSNSNAHGKRLRIYEMNPTDASGKDRRRIQKAVNTKKFHDKIKTEVQYLRMRVVELERENYQMCQDNAQDKEQLRQDNEQLRQDNDQMRQENEQLRRDNKLEKEHHGLDVLNEDSQPFCMDTSLGLASSSVSQRRQRDNALHLHTMHQDKKNRTDSIKEPMHEVIYPKEQNAKQNKDPFWHCPPNDVEDHSMYYNEDDI